jgi:hypothetical protein
MEPTSNNYRIAIIYSAKDTRENHFPVIKCGNCLFRGRDAYFAGAMLISRARCLFLVDTNC